MKLADIELLPGVIFDTADPKHQGRVKCVVPTIFDVSTMDKEGIPWIYPLTMAGYQQYSSPKKGTKVWVMHNKTNYQEFWYFPMFELTGATKNIIIGAEESAEGESGEQKANEEDYSDTEVLVSRQIGTNNNVTIYTSPSKGIMLQYGNASSININKDGEVILTCDDARVEVRDGKVFTGKSEIFEDSSLTQRTILGDNLNKLFMNISTGLSALISTAAQSPYTMTLCEPMTKILENLDNDTKTILAENTMVN